jgi:Cu/Ag efflux protein CusF
MPRILLPAAALAVSLAALCAGCAGPGGRSNGAGGAGETAAPAAAEPAAAPSGPVQTYQVRGEIAGLPDPNDPSKEFLIHHEAIGRFTGIDGDVVGMDSMTMPFPLAEGLSLAGLAVGDKVRFTLEVEWDGDPPYRITRIDKLPPDSALDFGAAPK